MSKKDKRKKVEKFILEWMDKLTGTDFNRKLYEELFKKMDDEEFDEFMRKLKAGAILNVIVPHYKGATKISLEKNFKLYKELGKDFFQYLIYKPKDPKKPTIKSKYKFLTLLLPFRRTKQTAEKGLSVPLHDKQIDAVTGQAINDSKGSKLSYPEVQVLNGMGLKDSVTELFSDRGGSDSGRLLKQLLIKYGKASKNVLEYYDSGTLSTKSLKNYFNGMHLKINL